MNKIITLLFAGILLCSVGASDSFAQKKKKNKKGATQSTAPAADASANATPAAPVDYATQLKNWEAQVKAAEDKVAAATAKVQSATKPASKQKAEKALKSAQADLDALKSNKPVNPIPEEQVRLVPLDSTEYNATGYNPISVFGIHKSRIMSRMRITRLVDLKEKCNTPFYNRGLEITSFLLDAVKNGDIIPYNDSLNKTITKKAMADKSTYVVVNPDDPKLNDTLRLTAKIMSELYIEEDLIFDRQRSQTRYDIRSISMKIPQYGFNENYPQFEVPFTTLRYKDVERVLDSKPTARWKNPYNNSEDRKYSEAFRLRLFCSHITKIMRNNPENKSIDQIDDLTTVGGPDPITNALLASQNFDYLLVSQENELYEY